MECEECGEVHEGTCGYTTDDEGNKLNSPGGTNKRKYSATTQTNYMSDSRRNPFLPKCILAAAAAVVLSKKCSTISFEN